MWIQLQRENERENACGEQACGVGRVLLFHLPGILSKQEIPEESHEQKAWP